MGIVLNHIFFSYGQKVIFEDFSKTFTDSVFYAIKAPSGKGKTTLFRLISGLEKVTAGKVDISGKLSYMFQENRLFPTLTVMENIKLVSSENDRTAEEVLDGLGLFCERNSSINELSGGMCRRVALARTLLAPSQNIILDEPFSGLDISAKDNAILLIEKMCKNKTLLIAVHNEDECKFCNESVFL